MTAERPAGQSATEATPPAPVTGNVRTFVTPGRRGIQRTLWLAGGSDIVLIAIGIASTYTYTWHTGHGRSVSAHHIALGLGVLAAAIAAVAVLNFMCFFWIIRRLTDAIAAAVVLTYFILLACMLNKNVQETLNDTSLGSTMLSSLTALTATAVGFYFAGSSYERAAAAKADAAAR